MPYCLRRLLIYDHPRNIITVHLFPTFSYYLIFIGYTGEKCNNGKLRVNGLTDLFMRDEDTQEYPDSDCYLPDSHIFRRSSERK